MIKGKYKRLVAYGCSFTAGDELADSQVLGIPEEEVDALKRAGISREELYGKLRSRTDEVLEINKTLAWPRWFADYYGVPYSNRARPGGSIQQMLYRLERDLANNLIDPDDLVIIGLTSMYRWFQFDEKGNELSWVFTKAFGAKGRFLKFNESLVENYVHEYNIIWQYYLCLNYLQMLADRHPNIKLVHAISPFSYEKDFVAGNNKLRKEFMKTIESMKFPALLNEKYGMAQLYDHLDTEKSTHGYGHPKIQFQKQFAWLVVNWIEMLDD